VIETTHKSLLGMDFHELRRLVEGLDQPAYRSRQLFEAIYGQRVESVDEISTLPELLREQLKTQGFSIGRAETLHKFASADGTVRYLMKFADSQTVETVWMP